MPFQVELPTTAWRKRQLHKPFKNYAPVKYQTAPPVKTYRSDPESFSELGNHRRGHSAPKPKKVARARPVNTTTKKKPVKVTKVKSLSQFTPDTNQMSQTVIRSSGGTGLSSLFDYTPSTGGYNPAPPPPKMSVVSTNVSGSRWDSFFGLASQLIAGSSKNKTVQTANGQIPLYTADQVSQSQGGYQQGGYDGSGINPRVDGAGAEVGSSLGSGFDGIIGWASQNPLIVVGFAAGAFLLFRQPPGSKK